METSHEGVESLAPPLPPPIPQPGPEFAERLAKAVGELRRHGERLAEQATADALEMALLIARRILEAELTTNPAALTGADPLGDRRLGEARKIQLRLCPADAAAVQAAGDGGPVGGRADGARRGPRRRFAVAGRLHRRRRARDGRRARGDAARGGAAHPDARAHRGRGGRAMTGAETR